MPDECGRNKTIYTLIEYIDWFVLSETNTKCRYIMKTVQGAGDLQLITGMYLVAPDSNISWWYILK